MTEQPHQRAVKTEQLFQAYSLAGQTLTIAHETTEHGEDEK